jgi:hypothetical protein
MEIKKFISKHGNFTVVESFVLDEKGFVWNENIHECMIIAGDTVVLYLEGEHFLDFNNATSDIAKQKFLYRQEMTRKNNE